MLIAWHPLESEVLSRCARGIRCYTPVATIIGGNAFLLVYLRAWDRIFKNRTNGIQLGVSSAYLKKLCALGMGGFCAGSNA